VNVSPHRRAQRSISQVGASAHASVCMTGGMLGPGGSSDASPAARERSAAGDCDEALRSTVAIA